MSADYQIGALWVGGRLTYLEQLCLTSFRDVGHHVVLYTYGKAEGAPAGVEIRDAAAILPLDEAPAAETPSGVALLSDLFRYRLLAREARTIWAETDAYALKAIEAPDGYALGWATEDQVRGGVLRLPPDSPALARLLDFTADPYAVPPWLAAPAQEMYRAAAARGAPVHAAEMPGGAWGGPALTHFLRETGEIGHARPCAVYYPFAPIDRRKLLRRDIDFAAHIGPETVSIHLYSRHLKRRLAEAEEGAPKPRSLIGALLRKHGIDPAAAPIPGAAAPAPAPDPAPAPAPAPSPAPVRVQITDGEAMIAPPPAPAPGRRADPAGRVLIVTTMKNEGPFLLEWIAYHRAIGVTDFLIYTNDCTDGTDAFHDLLVEKGIVTAHLDNPFREMNGVKPQHAALQDAQGHEAARAANWIIPMDVDEYVNIHVGDGSFQAMLDAAPDANMISMPWRLYGNGFVTEYRDAFITEQFEWCAHEAARKPHQAWGFKTAFRNLGIYRKFGVHRPVGLNEDQQARINWVDGCGRRMPDSYLKTGWRMNKRTWGYSLVTLNHYSLRSSESFLVKRDRGRVNHVDRDQGMAYWFRMNHNAERNRSIANKLPAARAEFDRLMADPDIAAMQAHCVAQHRAKIAELRARPEYAALLEAVESKRMRNLSRILRNFGNEIFLKGPDAVPEEFVRQADEMEALEVA